MVPREPQTAQQQQQKMYLITDTLRPKPKVKLFMRRNKLKFGST